VRAVWRPLLLLGAVAAVAVAAAVAFGVLYATKEPATRTVLLKPCGDRTFGHIRSLVRDSSGRWVMRFDPAWFTSGVTANIAAAEDGVVEPGEPVPNDNYRVDEGHRLLTYLVAPGARVTVLTRHGDPAQFGATDRRLAARGARPWREAGRRIGSAVRALAGQPAGLSYTAFQNTVVSQGRPSG
jgi:hypothetical protein